jgi:hypothetical protein
MKYGLFVAVERDRLAVSLEIEFGGLQTAKFCMTHRELSLSKRTGEMA